MNSDLAASMPLPGFRGGLVNHCGIYLLLILSSRIASVIRQTITNGT